MRRKFLKVNNRDTLNVQVSSPKINNIFNLVELEGPKIPRETGH